ncbi:MAG: hypothetical protein GQ536_09805 [Candidatus Aminicenantes bacterium]|nr:hypothetical protein [Candidatus Aminicenantes bacterium]NOR54364.1 hypothetical protein [Candidatus Aminicenantes bacterium]
MRHKLIFSLMLILTFSLDLTFSQKPQHFYDVDKEIKIEGTIQKIVMEPRYKNTSPFLIVILNEKKSKKSYKVELSPKRFFDHDLHKGENMMVTGSLYKTGANNLHIIAREIRFRGEILFLRDKHGFPNWRGGKKKRRHWRIS